MPYALPARIILQGLFYQNISTRQALVCSAHNWNVGISEEWCTALGAGCTEKKRRLEGKKSSIEARRPGSEKVYP
jgi:hypothetical protein